MDFFDLNNPKFWVFTSFILFALLSYKKLSALITRHLDDRSNKIQQELEQARQLRIEAETVLAQYKLKQSEYLHEAGKMLQKAREDSNQIVATAESEMKASLEARMKQAIEKIDQEEKKAIHDVRNHIVDIALAAARAIIVDHVGSLPQDELIKLALADMERKIH